MRILTTRLFAMRLFTMRRTVGLAAAGALGAVLTLGGTSAGASGDPASTTTAGSVQARHDPVHRGEGHIKRNKRTVVAFYTLAFNQQRPQEAVDRYVGPVYIQHNPMFADGPEAFVEAVTDFAAQFPELHVDIRTVIAEGDRVITHSLITTSPTDRGTVAADIFRLRNGKIVEHWDVVQPFPERSVNDHPMF